MMWTALSPLWLKHPKTQKDTTCTTIRYVRDRSFQQKFVWSKPAKFSCHFKFVRTLRQHRLERPKASKDAHMEASNT